MKEIKPQLLRHCFNKKRCCTIDEMAKFYNIPSETISSIIKRNREFLNDNLLILRNEELKKFKQAEELNSKTNKSLTIIFQEGVGFILSQLNHTFEASQLMSLRWCKKYENEMKYLIEKIFSKHHNIQYQYYDNGYIYDFLIDNKVVIECDENAHIYYNNDYEKQRTNYILSKKYHLLRYNTAENDMLSFIGEISYLLEAV